MHDFSEIRPNTSLIFWYVMSIGVICPEKKFHPISLSDWEVRAWKPKFFFREKPPHFDPFADSRGVEWERREWNSRDLRRSLLRESFAFYTTLIIQAVAQKFFFEKRAEGKRASPVECSELIRTMMNEKNDYFRFPLALCPSEKSLTSTFGTWETSP